MELFFEIIQFLFYIISIIIISKYILVKTLRNLAENLNLKPKMVGNITGISTSVPELLTICASSAKGLINTSIYNVLSSNAINLIQYYISIVINKNKKILKNKAIKIDVILAFVTLILPIIFIIIGENLQIKMIPILILLYIGFSKVNSNVHQLYLVEEKMQMNFKKKENGTERKNIKKIIENIIVLIIIGIALFFIGNLLGKTLESLCFRFNIPQLIIGILLGFATSIPELITFFEAQKHHSNSQNDILGVVEATNNLLTSNMMNLFIIQSLGIIVFEIFKG